MPANTSIGRLRLLAVLVAAIIAGGVHTATADAAARHIRATCGLHRGHLVIAAASTTATTSASA